MSRYSPFYVNLFDVIMCVCMQMEFLYVNKLDIKQNAIILKNQ